MCYNYHNRYTVTRNQSVQQVYRNVESISTTGIRVFRGNTLIREAFMHLHATAESIYTYSCTCSGAVVPVVPGHPPQRIPVRNF